jgi:hypothetical protein
MPKSRHVFLFGVLDDKNIVIINLFNFTNIFTYFLSENYKLLNKNQQ